MAARFMGCGALRRCRCCCLRRRTGNSEERSGATSSDFSVDSSLSSNTEVQTIKHQEATPGDVQTFASVVPALKSPSFRKQSLNHIQEEAHQNDEKRVLFLDIVLLGNHAQAAAEGACLDDRGKGPLSPRLSRRISSSHSASGNSARSSCSMSKEQNLSPALPEIGEVFPPKNLLGLQTTTESSSRWASEAPTSPSSLFISRDVSAISGAVDIDPASLSINILQPGAPPPQQYQAPPLPEDNPPDERLVVLRNFSTSSRSSLRAPEAQNEGFTPSRSNSITSQTSQALEEYRKKLVPMDSRRSSLASQASNVSRVSNRSDQHQDLCCDCVVDGYHIRMHFHPVERLNQQLPNFPSSHTASTGWVLLLPMESPDLDDVLGTLRQRLDEVRFKTRRSAAALHHQHHHDDQPRLARVELYNTVLPNVFPGEVDFHGAGPQLNCPGHESTELPFIQSSTQDMGTADLCDGATLFQTLVIKTAEWLMSRGAVMATSIPESSTKTTKKSKG